MGKVKFTTTMDENLLEKIKILAVKEKCSVSAILERLIKRYLEDEGQD